MWEELFYCLLIEALVLCYQPSFHNSFRLAIVRKNVVASILLQRW
jgi:hypothetical protein